MRLTVLKRTLPKGWASLRLTPSRAPLTERKVATFLRALNINTKQLTPAPLPISTVGEGDAWANYQFTWAHPPAPAVPTSAPSCSPSGRRRKGAVARGKPRGGGSKGRCTTALLPTNTPVIRSNRKNRYVEETSYGPIVAFLSEIGAVAYSIANGQLLSRRLLFERHICTANASTVQTLPGSKAKGTQVDTDTQTAAIHTVAGRTDIVVLDEDYIGAGHPAIEMWMVKVLIEIKTVANMKKSSTLCRSEGVVQLVGATASHTTRSPPVIITNLVDTHYVLYMHKVPGTDDLQIVDQTCDSFPAAIHFALGLAERESVTAHFPCPLRRGPLSHCNGS